MKAMAICRPRLGTELSDMAKLVPEEARMLEQMRDSRVLVEAYSPGSPGAVLILEVSDLKEAETLISRLPLSVAGLIDAEILALYPLNY